MAELVNLLYRTTSDCQLVYQLENIVEQRYVFGTNSHLDWLVYEEKPLNTLYAVQPPPYILIGCCLINRQGES